MLKNVTALHSLTLERRFMPVNDYRCLNCGHIWEEKFHYDSFFINNDNIFCPECGMNCACRVWHNIPVIYKSDGFYNTDSRKSEEE